MSIHASKVHETLGKHMLADGMDPVIDLQSSHGSWLVDGKDGKEYLDLFSMFASLSVGYNHPHILENRDRLTEAALNKPTNSDIYSTQMAEFVDAFARVAQPDYLPYAFFIEGGALAVENALKVAFDWKVRKNLEEGRGNKGTKVIHFKECFHGRTGYTMSLTDSPDPRKTLYFPKFDWPKITTPKLTFPLTEENVAKTIELENQAKAEIEKVIADNPHDVAAIILEPIQGEGGDNHFRTEFMEYLRKVSDENDIILIYDEVQSGIGVTGKMWAHEHYGEHARPDIISFGKKTQVCGIFASKRIDEVEKNVFHESSRLNSTWGGNLVDMVRFTLYLEVIEKENLVNNAAKMGDYLLDELSSLANDYENVSNIRGKGLFCAFDLPSGDDRDTIANLISEEGALILGCGLQSIRFRPHLNISKDEIDQGMTIIRRALDRL
ncbi:MAG: L-lysine 6-transaminase [Candidatus Marinimicrobia bacterium]|jgi:L-lysine 6-transaminase|nr:L-lysine 6-transaminase [Candidatus Neomarinimicrobiota bacterium]MBT3936443.1 L-lysine 6-transaminase [Candidatus Neomarinimicrobiota bacterium]MBT3960939.1 L-lysine 6-transaminase [Candidatus Neomarinimicrobiota bacterium]MBT4637134.1 L-lysine 6-transaminase [Candidatus Neomarinimicrobiota bacterium]MBT6112615.1 L-lysine 6-transaminase [Candidatus Neomarinimicrobiota bacterium]